MPVLLVSDSKAQKKEGTPGQMWYAASAGAGQALLGLLC